MVEALVVKRGATLRLHLQMNAPGGGPLNLSGHEVRARISWRGGGLDLTVSDIAPAAGMLSLSATASQSVSIPEGMLSRLVIEVDFPSGDKVWEEVPVSGISP